MNSKTKKELRSAVREITDNPRYQILAVRFLMGKSYRVSEPITKVPLKEDYTSIQILGAETLLAAILKIRGEWDSANYYMRITREHPTLLALLSWLSEPEPEGHKAKREAAKAAYMEKRRELAAKHRR